jgi:hypothetical protein
MALLVGSSDSQTCSRCGQVSEHRIEYAYCYANEEWLLKLDPETGKMLADAHDHRGGHAVEISRDADLAKLGWARRGGRLPICPEHRRETDENYPEGCP